MLMVISHGTPHFWTTQSLLHIGCHTVDSVNIGLLHMNIIYMIRHDYI